MHRPSRHSTTCMYAGPALIRQGLCERIFCGHKALKVKSIGLALLLLFVMAGCEEQWDVEYQNIQIDFRVAHIPTDDSFRERYSSQPIDFNEYRKQLEAMWTQVVDRQNGDNTPDSANSDSANQNTEQLMSCIGHQGIKRHEELLVFFRCGTNFAETYRMTLQGEQTPESVQFYLTGLDELNNDSLQRILFGPAWARHSDGCVPAENYDALLKQNITLYDPDANAGLLFPRFPMPEPVWLPEYKLGVPLYIFGTDPCRLFRMEIKYTTAPQI
ncbi:MAG: hypothetical protein KDK27_06355 [Leptospiraceae bacterium]|nr:hypothetical protein [Leptospiraceae bacterium]